MSDIARYRTKAEWEQTNPVLRNGEPGFEDDTGKLKIGDGVKRWAELSYSDTPPYTLPRENASFGNSETGPRAAPALSGRVAFFGDSITAYLYKYPMLAQALSLGRVQVTGLYSHGGYSSTQLVPLVTEFTEATPKAAKVVILCGTNDAQGTITGAVFRTNLLAMIHAAQAAEIEPILCTIPPLGAAFTAAKRGQVTMINVQVKLLASALNLQVIDFYSVLADPSSGQWRTGMAAGDGIHPAYAGQLAMAQATSAILTPITPAGGLPLVQANVDSSNLFSNALALTDSGGDGIPDGWDAWNGSTTGLAFSLVVDSAIRGRWATITATASSAESQIQARRVGGFTAGDSVYFACLVKTAELNAQGGFAVAVNWWKDYGGEIIRRDILGSGGPVGSGPGLYAATLVAPAGATQVSIQLNPAASTGVYQLGQVTGHNLTALGIA